MQGRIDELTEALGMGSFVHQRCETLSTGQKQRTSIARALVNSPAVLILDEPTSGLDLLAARDLLSLFREAADQGQAVLMSTHILAEVELICDRATVIHQGTTRASGTLEELRAQAGGGALSDGFFRLLGEAGPGEEAP